MGFMRNSLIAKMENQIDLESEYEHIKECAHIVVYFYQKNKDSKEYEDYLESMLDCCP